MAKSLLLTSLLCLLLFTVTTIAAPPGSFSNQLTTDKYNLSVTLQHEVNVTGGVLLYFEWKDDANYLRLSATADRYTIDEVKDNITRTIGSGKWTIAPTTPFAFSIMRRGTILSLERSEAILWRGDNAKLPGKEAGILLDASWTATDNRIQRISAVDFADNFMRKPDEPDLWKVQSGKWALQSAWDTDPHGNASKDYFSNFAANPFAWIGNNPDGTALCTTGNSFWEDYTMTVAVHPMQGSVVGVTFNMSDEKNGLLLRWTAANDRSPTGNTLGLYRMDNGLLTALKEVKGGFFPERWSRIAVESKPIGARVFIDGQLLIDIPGVTPWRGSVGLYTEGAAGAVFDDLTVYGTSLNTDIKSELALEKITEKFSVDNAGHLQKWSAPKDWIPNATMPSYKVYRLDITGEQWISATMTPEIIPVKTDIKTPVTIVDELILALNTDGVNNDSGYRAVVTLAPDQKSTTYTLYRGIALLATSSGDALVNAEEYNFRLWHMGDNIYLEQDGTSVLTVTDATAVPGLRPAYSVRGCFVNKLKGPLVMSHNVLDYSFDDAPADWINDGTWIATTRWACSPQWSFFAGWGRGDVALWQKNRFNGDHTFEAFVGIKMEYPRELDQYPDRYRDLGIAICGDGMTPRSGYSGIFGAPDTQGNPSKRMVILRNGVEVASMDVVMPNRWDSHRDWVHLQLQLKGKSVIFTAENYTLTYDDANPITGGIPAIWTIDNGISVARARIFFSNPPVPRTDPQIILPSLKLPEWVNIGKPLELDFSASCSTAGKAVTLKVTPQQVPIGEKALPVVAGMKVTFAPAAPGLHWYSIVATDGENTSLPFQLSVPVFEPAQQRDDSRALVLYRFNEQSGSVVHDISNIGTPADLTIPAEGTSNWLPERGLHLVKSPPLTCKAPLEKLMAIKDTHEMSIELWLNTDTMYPLTSDWATNLISMGSPETGVVNFALGTRQNYLTFMGTTKAETICYRTTLHHYVITMKEKILTVFRDGINVGTVNSPWNEKNWKSAMPLLLGSSNDMSKAYQGTFLLVAIHDRALSQVEAATHYFAGPDALEKPVAVTVPVAK